MFDVLLVKIIVKKHHVGTKMIKITSHHVNCLYVEIIYVINVIR
jgi:hypothetical protein